MRPFAHDKGDHANDVGHNGHGMVRLLDSNIVERTLNIF